MTLEICNFLILCSPYISGKLNSHIFVLGPKLPVTALGRSRPAADATREVVEGWLVDGL